MTTPNKEKLSVTIGIAAYNADDNIAQILTSAINQIEDNCVIKEIIVHSDNSQDNTISVASGISDGRIRIIDNKERRGFAGTVKYLLSITDTDLLVILNDDIKINDNRFISKLTNPFLMENGVGLTCGAIYPLPPKNIFIEKMAVSAANIYNRMRREIKNPHNKFTYDGAAMALSRPFIESIGFSYDIADAGNSDGYFYYSCLANGFKYRNVRDAEIYFRAPSTLTDYVARTSRNTAQSVILNRTFGRLVSDSYKKPKFLFFRSYIKELIRNPLECISLLFIGIYTRLIAKKVSKNFNPKWDSVKSTKILN